MYRARRNVSFADELLNIVRVVSLGMLIVMSVAFFYRDFSYSRVVFGLLWCFSIVSIFAGRALVHALERRLYRHGKHLQYAIILGNDALAGQVYTRLHGHPAFGIHVVGYFAVAQAASDSPLFAARYLGNLSEGAGYIKNNTADIVFIALRAGDHAQLFDIIAECEGVNVEFMMVPDMLEVLTSQMKVTELEAIPFVKVKSIPLTFWGRAAKRTFDVVISFVLLILLSPLFLVAALIIKLDSRGPVFFTQERIGRDGKRFTMYKFRSMRTGSERFDDSAGLGVQNDPRRTRMGVFLRRTSIDELPQLWNVLKGDMSLVGPRPERVRYVEELQSAVPKYLDRHRMKTGMTGWAQVNGLRGDTSIEERVKYDLYYVENWSLAFDIKILLRTVRAGLSGHGVDA
jgi:exopolysaccharide biosynthesis polyprenyl glycosylphosphotransferase